MAQMPAINTANAHMPTPGTFTPVLSLSCWGGPGLTLTVELTLFVIVDPDPAIPAESLMSPSLRGT